MTTLRPDGDVPRPAIFLFAGVILAAMLAISFGSCEARPLRKTHKAVCVGCTVKTPPLRGPASPDPDPRPDPAPAPEELPPPTPTEPPPAPIESGPNCNVRTLTPDCIVSPSPPVPADAVNCICKPGTKCSCLPPPARFSGGGSCSAHAWPQPHVAHVVAIKRYIFDASGRLVVACDDSGEAAEIAKRLNNILGGHPTAAK